MSTNENSKKMSKRNMSLFPIYKILSWDYLFFYTIYFLFLTQVKGLTAADVVLKTAFYSLFIMILQIPANILISFIGRKNSIILANVTNCFYVVIIMLCRNIGDLIFAEFISAFSFAIKGIAETSLLGLSIPNSRYKKEKFSKINSRGSTGYYILNAISKVLAGYLFTINAYLPLVLSLVILIVSTIISCFFIEPEKKKKENFDIETGVKEIKDIKAGFKFTLKSERLKAILLSSALITAILSILSDYEISLFQDINLSSTLIGIISAVMSLLSAYASKKERKFNEKFKNKSLTVISFILVFCSLISGVCGIFRPMNIFLMIVILASYFIYGYGQGVYYTIIERYLSNFSNKDIDTKIYASYHLIRNVVRVIFGFLASFILSKTTTANSLIIIGLIFTVLFILTKEYMKTRVGLKPEEYSKEERKYDEFISEEKV